jgi:F0F1-type ATP synthase assembly protein I
VGLEFALPPLVGVYLDRFWSLRPLATILGVLLGFAVGMLNILRIAREGTRS